MSQESTIRFFLQSNSIVLRDRIRLKKFIQYIFKNEKRVVKSLNYVFCSDKELLNINQTFLRHNFYTDIITFDLSPNTFEVDAEIYISADRVRANAIFHSSSFKIELHRVLFHGILHLCGYNDKHRNEKKIMREKENMLLLKYFG